MDPRTRMGILLRNVHYWDVVHFGDNPKRRVTFPRATGKGKIN